MLAEKGHISATDARVGALFPSVKGVRGVIICYSVVAESLLGRSLA